MRARARARITITITITVTITITITITQIYTHATPHIHTYTHTLIHTNKNKHLRVCVCECVSVCKRERERERERSYTRTIFLPSTLSLLLPITLCNSLILDHVSVGDGPERARTPHLLFFLDKKDLMRQPESTTDAWTPDTVRPSRPQRPPSPPSALYVSFCLHPSLSPLLSVSVSL
jgi:hypothetical protein